MWGVIVVGSVSAWLVWQCQRGVASVRAHSRVNPKSLLGVACDKSPEALRRRLRELAPNTPEARLLEGIANATDRDQAIGHLNELVIDVEGLLEQAKAWPRSAVRICVALGIVCGLVGATGRLGSPLGSHIWDLSSLLVGLFAAGVCGYLGRKAERLVKETRDGYNALIRALSGSLDSR